MVCMWWQKELLLQYLLRISNTHHNYLLHMSFMVYVLIKWPLFLTAYCLTESKAHPSRPKQSYRPWPKTMVTHVLMQSDCGEVARDRSLPCLCCVLAIFFKPQLGIAEWGKLLKYICFPFRDKKLKTNCWQTGCKMHQGYLVWLQG